MPDRIAEATHYAAIVVGDCSIIVRVSVSENSLQKQTDLLYNFCALTDKLRSIVFFLASGKENKVITTMVIRPLDDPT